MTVNRMSDKYAMAKYFLLFITQFFEYSIVNSQNGTRIVKDEYEVRPVVKAMTYAEMEISEKPLYLQFVVDI